MEKPCKSSSKKKTIFKLLPKAAAAAIFVLQNAHAPFSPSREKRLAAEHQHKNHHHKGFSGTIIPVIPSHQSGRKSEPGSPKISCMGQIKYNKKKTMNRINSSKKGTNNNNSQKYVTKKSMTGFGNMFGRKSKLISRQKSDVTSENIICNKLPNRAPCLSQMQRFASGREPLTNFDWRSIQITPQDQRKYYTDDDRGYSDDDYDNNDDEDEEISPFWTPVLLGRSRTTICLEPRKEINLWKRRTMVQPKPLQLH
ncbi:hypothetical protein P3S68_032164 [Capsicum galapagoense]